MLGFIDFLYFISVGYGLSLAFNGLSLLILYFDSLNTASFLLCILFIIYGIRLSLYIIIRKFFFKSYIQIVEKDVKRINSYTTFINIISWLFCSLLYTLLSAPIYFIIVNKDENHLSSYIFVGIAIFGLVFEAIADHQKTLAKKVNPKRFVDTGLYRIVRFPNYLGELIIWFGIFFSGIQVYKNIAQFLISLTGFLILIFIMFGGARRLEIRQDKNYGDMKEYKQYKSSVPIMIPFVPLYSVSKYTWLIG